jgi:hypothetical protein
MKWAINKRKSNYNKKIFLIPVQLLVRGHGKSGGAFGFACPFPCLPAAMPYLNFLSH